MYTLAILSLIAGASALTVPRSTCSFDLTASGGESGTIGQLSDGQNRIGGGLSAATFTISNGGITDAAGRGCILTPSVEQFQCDQGVGPTYGFAIESNGTLTSSGSSVFYACPASDTEWNLYTTPVAGQLKCVEILLTASGCGVEATSSATPDVVTVTVYDCALASSTASVITETSVPAESITIIPVASSSQVVASSSETAPESSSVLVGSTIPATTIETTSSLISSVTPVIETSVPASSTPVAESSSPVSIAPTSSVATSSVISSVASSASSASSCVATILTGSSTTGNYQYPHLIIPVSFTSPSTAYGTQYFGTISPNTSTIYNFDIPSTYSGSTCNLIFLLPLQSELETSSYTYSGSGEIAFEKLASAATEATTYDNQPAVESVLGDFMIGEGSSTLVESFECPAGETVTFELKVVQDTYLYYFQDWNPSPIGLFITYC